MDKVLVVYFSASGITRSVAKRIGSILGADVKEIVPKVAYTNNDLNWMDKQSRSSLEMNDKDARPEIDSLIDVNGYDTIILGFPIWWYVAPKIINTFIESVNLDGKKIYVFCTSGGSGVENAIKSLREEYKDLNFATALRCSGRETDAELIDWIK